MAKKTAPEPVYLEVGRRIEQLRMTRGFSQSELARRLKRCAIGRASVSNIESGRQRLMLHVLLEIAEVLDVEPGFILSSEPIMGPLHVESLHHRLSALQLSTSTIAFIQSALSPDDTGDGNLEP